MSKVNWRTSAYLCTSCFLCSPPIHFTTIGIYYESRYEYHVTGDSHVYTLRLPTIKKL